MVISTGITLPTLSSVAALYCLQKSIVCTPCGPRAVPTGGAGVALPAGSWILTMAATRRLAMTNLSCVRKRGGSKLLELGYSREFQLDRGLPAEDVDEHLELELVLVDLADGAGEVGERTFLDPHCLALFVFEAGPRLLGRLGAVDLDLQDALDLFAGQRGRAGAETDEAGDAGR